MRTDSVPLYSVVHELLFDGTTVMPVANAAPIAVPVSLPAGPPTRHTSAPLPRSVGRHARSDDEEEEPDRPLADVTGPPILTPLELQALLVGLSDGWQQLRIRQRETRGPLRALWRQMFGTTGVPPLANPKLEALRSLAMRHAGGGSSFQTERDGYCLTPELVAVARQVLAQCEPTPEGDRPSHRLRRWSRIA